MFRSEDGNAGWRIAVGALLAIQTINLSAIGLLYAKVDRLEETVAHLVEHVGGIAK